MYTVVILRDYFFDQQASLGSCVVYDDFLNRKFKGVSLERGWVNNQNMISCVPEGVYPLVYEYSPKFKRKLWEAKNVPGRSECKFHIANFWYQLNGCFGLGEKEAYIDNDPIMDVKRSGDTMEEFHKALEGQTQARLVIIDVRSII